MTLTFVQLLVLAIVQGLTEWLPISSSGHLILVPELADWPVQGALLDAMAHLGTLAALLVYFRTETVRIFRGGIDLLIGREIDGARVRITPDAKLALLIALATPPGLLFGIAYELFPPLETHLRTVPVIAVTLAVFGLLLWASDHFGKRVRTFEQVGWREAALIGLAQALAFIPGTSRSGITMTAARALGFERADAARFGMLAGVPLFFAAGGYAALTILLEGASATATDGVTQIPIEPWHAGVMLAGSFLAGWAAIWVLMNVVVRIGFLPFVIYRLALSAVLVWWLLGRG